MVKTAKQKTVLTERELDEKFPIVRASTLSLEDSFLKHEPQSIQQERLKTSIIAGINEGLKDYRRPAGDLSIDEEGNYIYKKGEKPAVGKSTIYGIEKLKEFMPEKNSRMTTQREYDAFLGLLIKYLIEKEGYSIEKAWDAICDDSKELGNYVISGKLPVIEPTGSRKVWDFYDLANVCKIVQDEQAEIGFSLVSGYCSNKSWAVPLSNRTDMTIPKYCWQYAVVSCSMDV